MHRGRARFVVCARQGCVVRLNIMLCSGRKGTGSVGKAINPLRDIVRVAKGKLFGAMPAVLHAEDEKSSVFGTKVIR